MIQIRTEQFKNDETNKYINQEIIIKLTHPNEHINNYDALIIDVFVKVEHPPKIVIFSKIQQRPIWA